jgi:VIT family protein
VPTGETTSPRPLREPATEPSTKRILEPIDRVSEVLFGLIMVLTFTGSISIAEAGRQEVRTMLIGALGCNLAWGIIDGILYLMGCLADRGRGLFALRELHQTDDPEKGRSLVAGALPARIASILEPSELESMRERLKRMPEPPYRAQLRRDDLLGAVSVFLWVFFTTFPVAIPFILMKNPMPALRVSNIIAIAMLYLTGFTFGRIVGRNPWLMGVWLVLLGSLLVGLTMALGG